MNVRFNTTETLVRLGGDKELLAAVVGTYLREVPGYLRDIDQALKSQNASNVKAAAHKLKGASATVGLECVTKMALSLEKAAEDGQDLNSLHAEFDAMQVHVADKVISTLQNWLDE
ncbi:MAG: Hpt domain-containing protein, partial [Limnobacter sp.]|nr:Hpt domain-containing protein [Limnobacter sp.]